MINISSGVEQQPRGETNHLSDELAVVPSMVVTRVAGGGKWTHY